jgi:hypothetical protein
MRLVDPLLVVALTLAGCGAAEEGRNVPTSSSEDFAVAPPRSASEAEPWMTTPPPVVLVTAAGKQTAVQGSMCVSYADPATGQGVAGCGDVGGPQYPEEVSAVGAGDDVVLVVPNAKVKNESTVTIRPLGCTDRETKQLAFPPDGELHWDVDLEPGAYQLDVFVIFATDDGRHGDTSGTLGLAVAGAKSNDALGVLEVRPRMQVCTFAE